jgi:hypothetical protein
MDMKSSVAVIYLTTSDVHIYAVMSSVTKTLPEEVKNLLSNSILVVSDIDKDLDKVWKADDVQPRQIINTQVIIGLIQYNSCLFPVAGIKDKNGMRPWFLFYNLFDSYIIFYFIIFYNI